MRHEKVLTKEEELSAFQDWSQSGSRKAEASIIESQAKLVRAIAQQYCAYYGMDLDELISEGNLGVIRALKSFTIERGLRFSTYASFWVRAYMREYVRNSRSIVRRTRKAMDLLHQYNRQCVDNLFALNRAFFGDVSLDKPVDDDSMASLMDTLKDPDDTQEEKAISENYKRKQKQILMEGLEQLSEKERFVIRKRFLEGGTTTLHQLAEKLNVTTEGVRLMEKRALRKLEAYTKQHKIE